MTDIIKLLIIEDDLIDQMAIDREFKNVQVPFEYTLVSSLAEATEVMEVETFNIILSDYNLGDGTGMELLEKQMDTPIILVTGMGETEIAVEAMKMGASDFVTKEKDGSHLKILPIAIERALKQKKAEQDLQSYQHNLEDLVKRRTEKLEKEIQARKETEWALEKAKTHLKEANSLLYSMTDTIPDLLWARDLDGKYIFTNKALRETMLGEVEPSAPMGKSFRYYIDKQQAEQPDNPDWFTFGLDSDGTDMETIKSNKACFFVATGSIRGNAFTFDVFKAPLRAEDGDLIGTVGSARDMTLQHEIENALEESEQRYRGLYEFSPSPLVLHDKATILAVNQAAAKFFHADAPDALVTIPLTDLVQAEYLSTIEQSIELWERGEFDQKPLLLKMKTLDGDIRDVETITNPVTYQKKEHWLTGVRDITESNRLIEVTESSLREKEALLEEINHRTKNNMQVMISMLNLQSQRLVEPGMKQIFEDTKARIYSMALVHDLLYKSQDLSAINLKLYIQDLTASLINTYRSKNHYVILDLDLIDYLISIDHAVPLGLVINEIISNSLKYAFPEKENGKIKISLKVENDILTLILADDGVGFDESQDSESRSSIGRLIINELIAYQIGGEISLDTTQGTCYTITIDQKDTIQK